MVALNRPVKRLSTAIYRGACNTPPLINGLIHTDESGAVTGTCALGSALWSLGHRDIVAGATGTHAILTAFGVNIIRRPAVHPVTHKTHSLRDVIISLNDEYNWNRRRVAAWVRTQGL